MKLDEIEKNFNDWMNHKPVPGIHWTLELDSEEILYLLKIAREAEKIAKFYSSMENWSVDIDEVETGPLAVDIDQGDKAREFLKLLEGEEK